MLLDRLIKPVASLRLTVACLLLALILVFVGTLAQVDLGLYKAQNEYFRSFFIFWGPKDASWRIPVFPGGYLIGGVLLINLIAAHYKRFSLSRTKAGIWMIHVGLILLLVGQLGTDLLSRETSLHLREGQVKNYSETDRDAELAVIDTTEPDVDTVVAIPQRQLMHHKEIHSSALPFVIRVKNYFPNSQVAERKSDSTEPPVATQGLGAHATARELPRTTEMDRRDMPSAILELVAQGSSLGTWLASDWIEKPQTLVFDKHTYELLLRPRRFYKPYSLQLLKFTHEVYAGTDTPKNFASRILLARPDTGEKREINIYMNNPLRYAGETYYQADWDHEDDRGTILQVVHNPSWLTPYFSCVLVGLGLLVQFGTHLFGFTLKRRTA